MAVMWFSVFVILSLQGVFGNVCLKKDNEFTCNECIRCGGEWCNERKMPHCVFSTQDSWCPHDREYVPEADEVTTPGIHVNPIYAERTLYIGKPNKLEIQYPVKSKQQPKLMIQQSTQSFNIELRNVHTECKDVTCVAVIEATPSRDFCNVTGGISEYVDVSINVGVQEEVLVKYHVPCACPCSLKVERGSAICNKNGNYSCGACSCEPGWTGEFCEIQVQICDGAKRGDVVQCSLNPRNEDDCSGNGYCSICETCICYTDREGSQYFDQENNCADLCMVSSECEDCLVNNTIGECYNCNHPMSKQRYNVSLTEERDEKNRKIWVKCKENFDDCGNIEYFAKRNEIGEITVMMVNHCNEVIAVAIVSDTKVPIILGVLGIVAAVAAVGGVMLWKHMNTVPPVPLNDPQYQNIDAEDCTGENPLYKPPTSSFKNPTYGKW